MIKKVENYRSENIVIKIATTVEKIVAKSTATAEDTMIKSSDGERF